MTDRASTDLRAIAMYVDVILPLAVPGLFTFALPEGLGEVRPGMRVAVPFGRGGKLYGGLVRRVHNEMPVERIARDVLSVLDSSPIVTATQLDLWERIADHYLCSMGEVMIAALPAQLTLSSETRIVANADAPSIEPRDARTAHLINALLEQEVLTMQQASELLGLKDPLPVVKRLMEQGVVLLEEELKDEWKPRMLTYVKLTDSAGSEEALHGWFDKLEAKAPKQLQLLMRFVELSRCMSDDPLEVERNKLLHLSGSTPAVLKQLVEKGLFVLYEREAGVPALEELSKPVPQLSEAQTIALDEVRAGFAEKNVVLLQGVTSSGKTELYTILIDEIVRDGGQVLYLLPEIALTTQIIERLRARFGERIAVFHSRMAQHERTALWMRMARNEGAPSIVVGARSALFLPYGDLRLVVVDEEHDPSYKQHDPAPRYHARDMAIVLASLHGAKTLLGSATPCMESLYSARTGKFAFARLTARYGDVQMPAIARVDLRDAQKRRSMRGHFSTTLIDTIQHALSHREQAIIFQNRRNYVPVWQCEACGWIPQCDHCDVSLTYHKHDHRLRCHYCSRHYPPPTRCGSCGGAAPAHAGLRHGEDRGGIEGALSRCSSSAHGPGHHARQTGAGPHHHRIRARRHRHPRGNADGDQGPRLRPCERSGHPQRRQPHALPGLPRARARIPTDGTGGGTQWPQEESRNGHHPGLRSETPRPRPGGAARCGRHVRARTGSQKSARLSALHAPGAAHVEASPRGACIRRSVRTDARAVQPIGRTCPGPGDPCGGLGERQTHPQRAREAAPQHAP
ncbi:MAG: primosomal protein N' [Flavobacteriales bacterium]|nr:primosomal protein N' [Flavobacteriales bacterium]